MSYLHKLKNNNFQFYYVDIYTNVYNVYNSKKFTTSFV